MTISVNIHEAKAQLSYLVAQARKGEEVIICNRNVPEAQLVPLENKLKKKREFGFMKGQIVFMSDFDDPIYTEEELDAIYDAPTFPDLSSDKL